MVLTLSSALMMEGPSRRWCRGAFATSTFVDHGYRRSVAGIEFDLSRTSVFLDFDGTISTVDVGQHLLSGAASPAWWDLHEQYERGEIESRECLFDQWALVEGDETTLRALAAEVELDPGFGPLVDALRTAGAELTIVSDGFGFYVHDA